MKILTMCLGLMFFIQTAAAQIELEREDVLYVPDAVFDLQAVESDIDIAMPDEGPNAIWNYQNLMPVGEIMPFRLKGNPNESPFPTATAVYDEQTFDFADTSIRAANFWELNDSELRHLGFTVEEFSITRQQDFVTVTVDIPEQTVPFDANATMLPLPLSYDTDPVAVTYNAEIQSFVTATLFFDNDPGTLTMTFVQQVSPVGSGTLNLDMYHDPFEAVMVLRTVERYDTIRINGEVPDEALLAQGGLSNGLADAQYSFEFWAPGNGAPVLILRLDEFLSRVEAASFLANSPSNERVTGVFEYAERIASRVYPNPSLDGRTTLQFEKYEPGTWNVEVYDALGTIVHSASIDENGPVSYNIRIPAEYADGLYFYALKNVRGERVDAGKLVVAR